MATTDNELDHIITDFVQELGKVLLKNKQLEVMHKFLSDRDVFLLHVIPVGFGKSLCFTCLSVIPYSGLF